MIEEVLAQIAAAEEKAAQKVEDAKVTAREISRVSLEEAEKLRGDFAADTKKKTAAILAEANATADKREAEAARAAESSYREILASADKNMRSTAEWLADMLVKGKYL